MACFAFSIIYCWHLQWNHCPLARADVLNPLRRKIYGIRSNQHEERPSALQSVTDWCFRGVCSTPFVALAIIFPKRVFLDFIALTALLFLWVTTRTPSNRCIDVGLASLFPPLVEQMHMVFIFVFIFPTLLSLVYIAQRTRRDNIRSSHTTFQILMVVATGSFLALSLPTTFALNHLVNH